MPPQKLPRHKHTGLGNDGEKLFAGDSLIDAPQPALTEASSNSLSSGGGGSLSTSDSEILQNAVDRLNDLESKLKRLGILF